MGMNHVTRQQDGSSALALDCQTRVKNAGLGDGQDECISQVVESRLLAAGARSASHEAASRTERTERTETEAALRTIATRLDRIAAAYIASLGKRPR
ncbi:MAG TPA: hypothetical protein VMF89_09145 [Polyangiales bacterium]|nr:hypothetical protein [Polyangiales bacterium]